MISNYIKPGDKVEFFKMKKTMQNNQVIEEKVSYVSQIYDISEDDEIKIYMPTEKGRIVLLDVGDEYQMVFYTKKNLYMSKVRITGRYKSNTIYLLALELLTNLKKEQRREYFRLECVLEAASRRLTEDEELLFQKSEKSPLEDGEPIPGMIVDISGGGVRLVTEEKYEYGDKILLLFTLQHAQKKVLYRLVSKVLYFSELENFKGKYEYRIQFRNLENDSREDIIRYIFEVERRQRKSASGDE